MNNPDVCLRCGSTRNVTTEWVAEFNDFGEEIGGDSVYLCEECWSKGETIDDAYCDWQTDGYSAY